MTVSTQGLEVRSGSRWLRAAVELLSSMRFAISLLTVICIASVIGTVLKQHEPLNNYINQFGPFWAEVFGAINLYSVYSAWWFLLILAFLVLSTSLCIARSTPKIIQDLKAYKENIREQSLRAFGHRAETTLAETPEAAARRIGQLLAGGGWGVKLQQRNTAQGEGWMVAAKIGGANKIGYLAAHSAIVLICLGGLLDGDLIVRAQTWFNGKVPYNGGGFIANVPAQHRLSESNPTFRGNLMVAEGTQSSTAILNQADGILLQELPFAIELKKFVVDYYSTGMPKLFASDIVIHDKATGEKIEARVEVNHPASYKGVEIYQSSFDDGGSTVKLQAYSMGALTQPFEISGVIGSSSQLTRSGSDEKLTLEYTGLRVINVENMAGNTADKPAQDLAASLNQHLGAGNKTTTAKALRNVGPSISYKLRDAAGQAREYNNYMLPVDTGDGIPVFLLGVRENPGDPYRYLRIPADDQGKLDGFVRLRTALQDPELRAKAVRRYATRAIDPKQPQQPQLTESLISSTARALNLFAGVEEVKGKKTVGLQALGDFLEANVPEAERNRAGDVLIRMLNGVLYELMQLSREQAGLPPLAPDEKLQGFMTQSVFALSDAPLYPAPMTFLLQDFKQVQASVFQVARAPGKLVVYLGCALLILGVFAMLYIRERRVWVWLTAAPAADPATDSPATPPETTHTQATLALSFTRKTLDAEREFGHLKHKLLGLQETAP